MSNEYPAEYLEGVLSFLIDATHLSLTIGIAATLGRALVELRPEHLTPFELHRFIQQRLHRLRPPLETVLHQQLQNILKITA